ncbi:hypothetical protein N431DRAFT_482636 [Stipitochalara longipes BDJ]|nr:hypothetical protein N431DRAFT_482636 [Stipitochalara longipes BDJ]
MAWDLRDVAERVDEALLTYLPEGGEIVSVTKLGLSDYCDTSRYDVRLPDGSIQRFFEKAGKGPGGYELMMANWTSETSLHSFIPEYVPRPVGFGTYKSKPEITFFVLEFVNMIEGDIPRADSYMAPIIQLALKSMNKGSPNGKFGFGVNTHFGHLPQTNDWESSWEVWWTKHMKFVLDREELVRGSHTPEAVQLKKLFIGKVLPRYLRPLESDGRSVKPCLLHSDLWPGNVKYKLDNTTASIYDASGLWGHNEFELGVFRNPRYPLGEAYLKEYWKHVPISEPEDDADSRNIMYMIRNQACLATIYPDDPKLRDVFISNLRLIVARVLEEEASHKKVLLEKLNTESAGAVEVGAVDDPRMEIRTGDKLENGRSKGYIDS